MMDVHHAGKQMGAAVDVRYWTRQSAAAPSMLIPGCLESDSARSPSPPPAALGSTAVHAGGDREAAGRTQLAEVACVAKPDTILAWYRRLIARKFDGSKSLVSRASADRCSSR